MTKRSYKATGINLKAMPMGESDRLVTILTPERGLLRAIAPGARKHKSRLGGRSGLFVVNECLFAKGKSLDKLVQAETQRSFPGLSQNLAKLTASQYLAEIALSQALSDQPQTELYTLLIEHLTRLEAAAVPNILPCLAQATFHLLALAGVAPEVFRCCLTRSPLTLELGNPDWRTGFSVSCGGAVALSEIERLERDRLSQIERLEADRLARLGQLVPETSSAREADTVYASHQPIQRPTFIDPNRSDRSGYHSHRGGQQANVAQEIAREIARDLGLIGYLSAAELALMQQLSKPELVMSTPLPTIATPTNASLYTSTDVGSHKDAYRQSHPGSQSGTIGKKGSVPAESGPHKMWRHIEKFLRHYVQYQFDRPIRSATLIDTCFTPLLP